ncbi:MAG: citramalate synthase [Alphaproteobacteria bacterium GM7ARS4]|nr:citramalate synthase [Alphaproteobacteria bacterium GM7ARS4]
MTSSRFIHLYDSTLRDGAQTLGVYFRTDDKRRITTLLDEFGIDFIEGGWPSANPTDDAFFADIPQRRHAHVMAFGMTHKKGRTAQDDPQLQALVQSDADGFCIVGKCWDFHVEHTLHVGLEDNLRMIADSVAFLRTTGKRVIFDGEHFFDGYKQNRTYAMECLQAAAHHDAHCLVLCDTNGGSMPDHIAHVTNDVVRQQGNIPIGIHCHNDMGLATANSLAAVEAGARHVQGTFNGLGERCGNADLVSIIPTLVYKMGYQTNISQERLRELTFYAHAIDHVINRLPSPSAPYVGTRAFAHKGGLHSAAVMKNPLSYEHIDPARVGNQRQLIVSNQAGKTGIRSLLETHTPPLHANDAQLDNIASLIKQKEFQGYSYDKADASCILLARSIIHPNHPRPFAVKDYHVTTCQDSSTANVTIQTPDEKTYSCEKITEEGPFHALDSALRCVLQPLFPSLSRLTLSDYKVLILPQGENTAATTRVMITFTYHDAPECSTIGVSANIIHASWEALLDAFYWALMYDEAEQNNAHAISAS